eukprot:scaffold58468_cov41-Phaeocystis_antarctica.AAC.3
MDDKKPIAYQHTMCSRLCQVHSCASALLLPTTAHPCRLEPRDAATRQLLRVRRILRVFVVLLCGRRSGLPSCSPARDSPLAPG